MKTVAIPVDFPRDQFERVAEVLVDMGFGDIQWREAAAPPKPGARRNIEQLRKYGVEFTDIRRFEVAVPEDMPLEWVRALVHHALHDAGLDVEPGEPIALE